MLQNHIVVHFFKSPVEGKTAVLHQTAEALPGAVVTEAARHCCGYESLPWFPSDSFFFFKCTDIVAWVLWADR